MVLIEISPLPTVTCTSVNRDFLLLGRCSTSTSLFDASRLLAAMLVDFASVLHSRSIDLQCTFLDLSRLQVKAEPNI